MIILESWCSLTFHRTRDVIEDTGQVVGKKWIITLSIDKMSWTDPAVSWRLPILSLHGGYPLWSTFGVTWISIETNPAAFWRSITTAYSTTTLITIAASLQKSEFRIARKSTETISPLPFVVWFTRLEYTSIAPFATQDGGCCEHVGANVIIEYPLYWHNPLRWIGQLKSSNGNAV